MRTGATEEEELAERQAETARERAADSEVMRDAVQQATAEFQGPLQDAVLAPMQVDEQDEWTSDGEAEDDTTLDAAAEGGYGVVDMRDAHQVMILTQVCKSTV